MQPLKLTIPGSYYDTQIYSGRLYLWCNDNSLRSLNWDELIDSLKLQEPLKLAAQCGFKRSDYLYGTHWDLIFQDSEIQTAITEKFEKLAARRIHVSKK